MRRRPGTGEARQPEVRAGRGEPRWLPGAGGRGMTRRLRPELGEQWASCRRRWQQSRRTDAWRAGAVYVVGRRACAGCGLSHQGAETSGAARAFPVLPCAFPALRGFAPRRGAGTVRNAWRRSSRQALRVPRAAQGIRWRACSAALCSAAPRGECVRRRVQQKRQEENGNLSQGQGRYDVASLGGEERRGAVTVDVGSGELRQ